MTSSNNTYFSSFRYEAIYGIALSSHVLAILYGVFFIKDTKKVLQQQRSVIAEQSSEESAEESKGSSFKDLFSLSHIKESFMTAFRKREGGLRHIVVILILTFGISGIAAAAGSQVSKSNSRRLTKRAHFVFISGEQLSEA